MNVDCANQAPCCCDSDNGFATFKRGFNDEGYPVAGDGMVDVRDGAKTYDDYLEISKSGKSKRGDEGAPRFKFKGPKENGANRGKGEARKTNVNESISNDFAKDSNANAPVLDVTFQADGSLKRVRFTERPLGMKFQTNSSPLTVTDAPRKRQAHAKGVRAGWQIVEIAGEDVSSKPFAEVSEQLAARSSHLALM